MAVSISKPGKSSAENRGARDRASAMRCDFPGTQLTLNEKQSVRRIWPLQDGMSVSGYASRSTSKAFSSSLRNMQDVSNKNTQTSKDLLNWTMPPKA